MSSEVKIEYNYNTIDRIRIDNMGSQVEFDKFIESIKERSLLWANLLIKEATDRRFEEAKKEEEIKQKEAFLKIRQGICNLELCYANGKQSKCRESGGSSYLGMHPTKGFKCLQWGHAYPCQRVTPTGRISVNRTRYNVLDRFKLIFFKKAVLEEIQKIRDTYKAVEDEANKKIAEAQIKVEAPIEFSDVLGAMNGQ